MLLALTSLSAQTITYLPNQSQLPVGNVHYAMQDSEGYMWYATNGGGLCRDNGFQIDVFTGGKEGSDRFTNLNIEDIVEDRNRHLWIATDGGLFYLDKRDYSIHRLYASEIKEQTVNTLCLKSDGSIWAAFSNHYARFNDRLEMEKLFTATNAGDGNKRVNGFYEDSHHRFFMLECRGDILQWDERKEKFLSTGWTGPEPTVMAEDTHNGKFWVGTWGEGIYTVKMTTNGGRQHIQSFVPNMATHDKQVVSILYDEPTNTLYSVDMRGIGTYSPQSDGILQPRPLGFSLPTGYHILDRLSRDRMGNVWVSGFTPHTFIISNGNTSVRRNPIPSALAESGRRTYASTIIADGKGLWLWLRRVGLAYYQPSTGKCLLAHEANGQSIQQWHETLCSRTDGQGGVWVADGRRVVYVWYDGNRVDWRELCTLDTEPLAFRDDGRGTLFIGTNHQILSFDYRTPATKARVVVDDAGWVSELALDSKGNIYFVNKDRHLTSYNPTTHHTYVSDSIDNVYYIRQQADGTLLNLSQNGTIWQYNPKDGSESLLVHSSNGGVMLQDAAFDHHGNLWEVQDQKVYRRDMRHSTARGYHCNDANLNVDYLKGLAIVGDSVYVGGCGALLCFDASASAYSHNEQLCPVVACVVVDGRRHFVSTNDSSIEIDADDKVCEIQLAAFNYLDSKTQQFLYRIPELSKEWKYLPMGQNTIQLIGLSKGTYTLETRMLGGSLDDDTLITTFVIHRLPAWWETWWAYLIYILLFTALIITVEHYVRHYRATQMKLSELQQRLDELVKNAETTVEDIPQQVASNEQDQQFLQQMVDCINRNMDNTDYSVEALASDLCMSRMNLYRKLTSLTGQKPAEFIRTLRLKRAAEILRSYPDKTIAEVADLVGFSTSSYFSKCFKDMFGCLPTQYK